MTRRGFKQGANEFESLVGGKTPDDNLIDDNLSGGGGQHQPSNEFKWNLSSLAGIVKSLQSFLVEH